MVHIVTIRRHRVERRDRTVDGDWGSIKAVVKVHSEALTQNLQRLTRQLSQRAQNRTQNLANTKRGWQPAGCCDVRTGYLCWP
jgi:hypothetical protein